MMRNREEEGEGLGLDTKVESLWGIDRYSKNWRVNKVTRSHEILHTKLSKQHKQSAPWTKGEKTFLNSGREQEAILVEKLKEVWEKSSIRMFQRRQGKQDWDGVNDELGGKMK